MKIWLLRISSMSPRSMPSSAAVWADAIMGNDDLANPLRQKISEIFVMEKEIHADYGYTPLKNSPALQKEFDKHGSKIIEQTLRLALMQEYESASQLGVAPQQVLEHVQKSLDDILAFGRQGLRPKAEERDKAVFGRQKFLESEFRKERVFQNGNTAISAIRMLQDELRNWQGVDFKKIRSLAQFLSEFNLVDEDHIKAYRDFRSGTLVKEFFGSKNSFEWGSKKIADLKSELDRTGLRADRNAQSPNKEIQLEKFLAENLAELLQQISLRMDFFKDAGQFHSHPLYQILDQDLADHGHSINAFVRSYLDRYQDLKNEAPRVSNPIVVRRAKIAQLKKSLELFWDLYQRMDSLVEKSRSLRRDPISGLGNLTEKMGKLLERLRTEEQNKSIKSSIQQIFNRYIRQAEPSAYAQAVLASVFLIRAPKRKIGGREVSGETYFVFRYRVDSAQASAQGGDSGQQNKKQNETMLILQFPKALLQENQTDSQFLNLSHPTEQEAKIARVLDERYKINKAAVELVVKVYSGEIAPKDERQAEMVKRIKENYGFQAIPFNP